MSRKSAHPEEPLGRDERGAIYVVALFMATFLVGMIYLLSRTGDSIARREQLQDRADVGAFSAAVLHARSLNSIGLINNVQLAGMSVLQASLLILENAGPCSINSEIGNDDVLSACDDVARYYEGVLLDGRLRRLLRTGTRAAESIRDSTPALATLRVSEGAGDGPLAVFVERPLPIETRSLAPLCAKGNLWKTALLRLGVDQALWSTPWWPVQPIARIRRAVPHCPAGLDGIGPQVMNPKNWSGYEMLQVRTLALDDPERLDLPRQDVVMADRLDERTEPTQRDADRAALAMHAFAQAEYYSEWRRSNTLNRDTERLIPEENLFYMHWRARLRRFRITSRGDPDEVLSAGVARRWIANDASPSCVRAMCAVGECGRCDHLDALEDVLGGALH